MGDCIFCQIVLGKVPAKITYETESLLVFSDIMPQAPIHQLIIPKKHITNILDFDENDATLIADLFVAVKDIAKQTEVLSQGFRLVNNTGSYGGQTVHHVHFHLLGGRFLAWPPG